VPYNQSSGHGAEAELDTQYMTATAPGLKTYVYYISSSEDDFLMLISYVYRTWNEFDAGPSVISISYGADEYEFGRHYCRRINHEFGKLALHGISVVAASGDEGAVGIVDGDDEDCREVDGTAIYSISFPASAPYVTAVGGTMGGSISMVDSENTTGEIVVDFSGGGFSEYFHRQEWQIQAIDDYFDNKSDISYPSEERYTSKRMRAIPDISAQAVYYVIRKNSAWYIVSGTSCSCPAVAGMISMINVNEVLNGRATVGWINPILYDIYQAQDGDYNEHFNDVVEGDSYGCSVDDGIGWYAAKGWDPVTGVGTPKFGKLLEQIASLWE